MSDSAAQYAVGGLLDAILGGLREAGKDTEHLTADDLAGFDEFHVLGQAATIALAEAAALAGGEDVLDVGCGIGGPARLLARRYGCKVTGVDLTEEFCAVATELNRLTGLDDIRIEVADALALPFPDASFDVVWTQHASMNIADKAGLYRELHRVVRPGGRLAFFDIVAGPVAPLQFPVPWADVPERNFLESPELVRAHVESAGFEVLSWEDLTDAGVAFVSQVRGQATGPAPLRLLVPDLPAKIANLGRNLGEDRARLIRCVGRSEG